MAAPNENSATAGLPGLTSGLASFNLENPTATPEASSSQGTPAVDHEGDSGSDSDFLSLAQQKHRAAKCREELKAREADIEAANNVFLRCNVGHDQASSSTSASTWAAVPFEGQVKIIGTKVEGRVYVEREAVRCVIMTSEGLIGLLYAENGSYWKLPGGGVEDGESHEATGKREALEEMGVRITMGRRCIGIVEEYRGDLHQVSYLYLAHKLSGAGRDRLTPEGPRFTAEEKNDGLSSLWVFSHNAIQLAQDAKPTTELGLSIKERDLFFLEQYEYLTNDPNNPLGNGLFK